MPTESAAHPADPDDLAYFLAALADQLTAGGNSQAQTAELVAAAERMYQIFRTARGKGAAALFKAVAIEHLRVVSELLKAKNPVDVWVDRAMEAAKRRALSATLKPDHGSS